MIVLFDTNVVLDVLLDRAPHAENAAFAFAEVENGRVRGLLGATTVTTIHYLTAKAVGGRQARKHLQKLLTLFAVAPVTREVLVQALDLSVSDYEDAVLHEAARMAGADAIVTRDPAGFRGSQLRVYSPFELLAALRAGMDADA
ncbi:MAG TPA: PIN domain-containing protein [Thermoanaerobaculia bacterium]|nr:PIN domain-containing protein [Thermoanaerobaculia bacterium]